MKVLVCIPTYNECSNILKLIPRVLRSSPQIDVLVIDDNSPDGTGDLVEEFAKTNSRVFVLKRERKQGLGPAYLAGFNWGLTRSQEDYGAFIEMDADLSHRPRYLGSFLRLIQDYDLVVGSRWKKGGRIVNWSLRRIILSRLANLYAKLILGAPVDDLTAGFVCYRRRVLEQIGLDKVHSDGYGFQIEMKYRALVNQFKLVEIPICFTDRKDGDSKISRRIVFEALFMVLFLKMNRGKLVIK